MSAPPVTVRIDSAIDDAARHMREARVRRLPIVDHDGCLVGIVTLDDLTVLFAAEMGERVAAMRADRGP
jgi:CBS domain-containing protein